MTVGLDVRDPAVCPLAIVEGQMSELYPSGAEKSFSYTPGHTFAHHSFIQQPFPENQRRLRPCEQGASGPEGFLWKQDAPLSYASARTVLRAEKPLHRGLSLCYMTPVLEMEAVCQLES